MIVAGIDEAGYGPLLGPLVVGSCAIELPGLLGDEDPPCLWTRLKKVVSRTRSRTGQRLHVNDSKAVYTPAAGLRELERSVLSMHAGYDRFAPTLDALLASVAPSVVQPIAASRWYQPLRDEPFPLEQEAMSIQVFANAFKSEQARTGTRLVYLNAQVLLERELNQQLHATRNKSSVLFSTTAIHLDHLLRRFGNQDLVVFCDRQGGRSHYGHLLRLMFEEWDLRIVCEEDSRAEYHLLQGDARVRVIFAEKAEARCLSVAVASMLSKYLREALMRRFNAWWRQWLPELAPTAGYYQDGTRFLREIDAKRRELDIPDVELIRSR